MEFLIDTWNYVIVFLIVLTMLVFVHEMGHYLIARRNGVRVEVFSVGFGPEIFGRFDRLGTRWKFGLIPVGGYVKMFGETPGGSGDEVPAEPLSVQDQAVSFHSKTLRQRAAIVFAGPLANLIFAVVIFSGLFMVYGQSFTPADIDTVLENSAAERAGFQPGDVIKSIDGTDIERFEQVVRIVRLAPGQTLEITVSRDGRDVELTAIPDRKEQTDRFGNTHIIGQLGVSRTGRDRAIKRYDPATAVWRAIGETAVITGNIFDTLWQMIIGVRTAKELGGPIRIAQMSGDIWQMGLDQWLYFAAVLSINLGLINLFPVPMLDGGHLLFYVFEAIRGRPLGERAQDFGFRIGIVMVLALMIFATWNDLVQLRVVDFLVDLVT